MCRSSFRKVRVANSATNASYNSISWEPWDGFCGVGSLFFEKFKTWIAECGGLDRVVKIYCREIGIASAIALDD